MGIADLLGYDSNRSDIENAVGMYVRGQALHGAGSMLRERYLPSEEEQLRKKKLKLEIANQKRALGLPTSDEDYEDAVNNDKSFVQRALPAFGRETARRIPSPGLLQHAPSSTLVEAIPKKLLGGLHGGRFRGLGVIGRIFG